MSNPMTVEIVLFKLNAETDEAAFLQAAEAVTPALRAMTGFIDRALLKDENGHWLDIMHWQNREAAVQAAEIFPTLECAKPFGAMLDWSSVTMLHLQPVRTWCA